MLLGFMGLIVFRFVGVESLNCQLAVQPRICTAIMPIPNRSLESKPGRDASKTC
jgi:hypothetical protein